MDFDWLHFGFALAWLAAAALFARWNRPDEPSAIRRVPLTALAFAGGLVATTVLLPLLSADLGEAAPLILGGTLIVGLATFLSAVLVDAGAAALGATRTPQWLAAGIVIAILVTYAWLSFVLHHLLGGYGAGEPPVATSFGLALALLAAAAGLVWWSELPRPAGADGDRFE